jgi:hypothetical protein
MNSNNPTSDPSSETFQEGTTPVQFFTSKAIPVLPDSPLEARLGRPVRTQMRSRQEEKKVLGDQPPGPPLAGHP